MDKQQLLKRLNEAWTAVHESYAGLTASQLTQPGIAGDWSVKDILAHLTTWEEEALKHLPVIIKNGTPPKYSTTHGGIDAFNAKMTGQKRRLSLSDVLRQSEETHARLVEYIQRAPVELFTRETRFRRRLRLDTYGHYKKHAAAVRRWRNK